MDEREISVAEVEREHLEEVNQAAHWAYVVGVLGGSFLVMLAFIAWLGSSAT
jgi:uncharacterized membrane protein YdcZ (DUF606 family)